jgi:beta-glucosidase
MQRWIGSVGAVLEAWYAGAECGNAIARVVFGAYNPAGRLPITFPATTGQCPLYYNPRPHGRVADYCDHRGRLEQFAFGHGLSYTRFDYSALRVAKTGMGRKLQVKVSCTVKNVGGRDGDEVVQLYLRDCYSRITRPILELKRFQRIHLKAGAAQRVAFTLRYDDFTYLDEKLRPILEPGDFRIAVGASSADLRLEKIIRLP